MANTGSQCDIEGVLNEKQGSCVTQHLPGRIAVEYEIHFDTTLNLPYAFHWNGVIQPDGRVAKTGRSQIARIRALVRPGQTVGLYLGSDASPEFRTELLYPITVGSNDIKVVIKTKAGLHDSTAEARLKTANLPTGHGDLRDEYEGALTGDIWMRFSHRYTAAEATTILSQASDGDQGLAEAIRAIYGGAVSKQAGLTVQFAGKHALQIRFQSGVDSNCVANIKNGYGFGAQCLPRLHPKSWIALLQAARDAGIASVEITSGWRPMFGSAGHRIGLGLDVKSAKTTAGDDVVFDRSNQHLWHGHEERDAHHEWVEAEKDLERANVELKKAIAAEKKAKGVGKEDAEMRRMEADAEAVQARRARDKAKGDFKDRHNNSVADSFEQSLLKNPLVKQLFDPLLMDANTVDNVEPAPNRLRPGNEATHKNHLHITARDIHLLP